MDTLTHELQGHSKRSQESPSLSPTKRLKTQQHSENQIQLNSKQQQAADLVQKGANVFITGPAGTGKSVVLRRIIEYLSATYKENEWVAVAPTGVAAVAIGGQTIHSFAGCGVPDVKKDFERCWEGGHRMQWRSLKAMVVDEISMISGEFWDRLADVVCRIRRDERNPTEDDKKPFGGIQLILCGDFLQLPPIPKKIQDIKAMKAAPGTKLNVHCDKGFAFQAKAWKESEMKVVELTSVYRQDNENFQMVLEEIRKGQVSTKSNDFLQKCNRALKETRDGIKVTTLYPKNKDVTRENLEELRKLAGLERCFWAHDHVEVYPIDSEMYPYLSEEELEKKDQEIRAELQSNHFFYDCRAEMKLQLKVGAQVMLLRNERSEEVTSQRLFNGSRGTVVRFVKGNSNKKDDELEHLDDNEVFHGIKYPVVKFFDEPPKVGPTKVIKPEIFTSRIVGKGECKREAIPLKLAWAVTIHKSQGMTLEYVKTDMSEVFTEAQVYVALSRAKTESGLQLHGFSPKLVKANNRALAFHENPDGTFPCWDQAWDPAKEAMKDSEVIIPPAKSGCLQGLAFVFTGETEYLSRVEVESLVKACGGFVRSCVSGKTNYLVIGHQIEDGRDVKEGTKYKKAEEFIAGANKSNLKILNEKELYDLIRKKSERGSVGLFKFFGPK